MSLIEQLDISFSNEVEDAVHFDWTAVTRMIKMTIDGLLARSGRTGALKKLRLHDIGPLGSEGMLVLLQGHRSLEHLILDYFLYDSAFFLRLDRWTRPMLPALTTLELLNVDDTNERFQAYDVYTFLRGRGKRSLRRVDDQGNGAAAMKKFRMTVQRRDESYDVPPDMGSMHDIWCDVSLVEYASYHEMCVASSFVC